MIRLDLPEPPNIANARLHWAAKNRKRKAYVNDAWLIARSQVKPPTPPYERVKVRAHLRLWNLRDEDNLTASIKWALDALRGVYFVDDDPAHLTIESVTQEIQRSNRGLTLEIEPA